jgi:Ca2+-binding RTX toxin-like protein
VIGGQNSLAASGCLVVSAGAVIDFTVAAQENSGIALIDHYDYISGRNEATYTITIKESQASGQYSLAGYAGDFNSNVSVQTEDGQTIGYITGWRDLEVGGRTYSLSIAPDATLKLTIAGEAIDATAPTITNIKANVTAFTNGDVTVSAVFADETELAQSLYRLGAGDWLAYSGLVTMTDNGTVYFRAVDAAGNVAEAKYEVVNIDKEKPDAVSDLAAVVENNLVTFSWSPTTDNLSGMAGYEIEVSDKSDFSHLVASSSGASLTNYETRFSVSGIYYYRVRATDAAGNASPWTTNQVDYEYVPMAEQLVGTPGDDVFNMVPDGTWGTCHVARWNGGTETVSIAKRNRFHDALVGGVGGYDVVALPDGDNALLYHDLLSPCADGTEASARLAGISEICGNCGNDVIDLTAANGCYAGDLLLKGGDGNDHLWSGFGDDILIGGTGNDDLRGGTGNDLYLFGTDWGHDTVVDDGGTLVFDSALQGNLAVRATDSGTSISDGHNMVSVSWQVEVGDLVFAEVGELQEYRRDTIKAFLA